MTDLQPRHIYDRPIGVVAILVALLVLGALTLPSMRINLKPDGLTASLIYVNLYMDTESSAEVLDELTRPAEEILRALPGVSSVSSRTSNGRARLYVSPAADVSLTTLTTQVSEALDNNSHRLPVNRRPQIGTFSESDPPMVAAAFNPGKYDDATFRDLMERIMVPALLRVPGVAVVSHNLEGEGSVLLAFSRDRVTASKTDLNKVTRHFSSAQPRSYQVPVVEDGVRGEQIIRVQSPDLTQSGIADVPIANGNQVKQIALIEQLPSNYGRWVLVDGRPGCTMVVYPSPEANSYISSKEVTRVIEEISAQLGVHMVLQSATHVQIDAAAMELFEAAMWGAIFSVFFLLIFLRRLRLAILVCLSLPLSLSLALLMMACHNNTINLFTLMGFLLACGMVVDNAIVVGEALLRVRRCADPVERKLALRRAVSSVSLAIVVCTLTTISLFMPVLVVENPWVRVKIMAIGEPIIWSLLGSLAVALIVVPMAFPRLYPVRPDKIDTYSSLEKSWLMKLERSYGRVLGWLMMRPLWGFVVVIALVIPVFLGNHYLKEVPKTEEEDNRYLKMDIDVRGNPTSTELAEAFAEWYRIIEPHKKELAISSVIFDWKLTDGDMHVYLDPIDPKRRHENEIQEEVVSLLPPLLVMGLDEHFDRARSLAVKIPATAAEIAAKKLEEEKRKAETRRRGPSSRQVNSAGSTKLSFRLLAPNEETIDETWLKLRPVFEKLDAVTNPGPTIAPPDTETEMVLTRDAEERGWRADQLAGQVTRYAGTRQLLTMPDGSALTVGPLERELRTLQSVQASDVYKNDGDQERLENLISYRQAAAPGEIRRRDGLSEREYWIYVLRDKKEYISEHLNDYLRSADPPQGAQIDLSYWEHRGKQEDRDKFIAKILAGIIIYLLMGILYESILAPVALMFTVYVVYTAVLAVLKLIGIQIDGMVDIGLFLLIGVVVNHGVVLVDRLSRSVPMHRLDRDTIRYPLLALAAGARRRFTPVVLTSLVTIAAAFPMIFGNGRFNGDAISGLGSSLAIGMGVALFFTLFVVPLIYRWLGAVRAVLLRILRAC